MILDIAKQYVLSETATAALLNAQDQNDFYKPNNTVPRAYEILRKTGRCLNGYERDGGVTYHAVRNGVALCGTAPRRLSGWGRTEGEAVTCPKCSQKLEKLSGLMTVTINCKNGVQFFFDKVKSCESTRSQLRIKLNNGCTRSEPLELIDCWEIKTYD